MSRPALTHEQRFLPTHRAGAITPPRGVQTLRESLSDEIYWPPHAHATHELLWNETGISMATVGARTWAVSPQTGLWIPAGVVHAGHAPSGTTFRAAYFDAHQFPPRLQVGSGALPSTLPGEAHTGAEKEPAAEAQSPAEPVPVEVSPLLVLLIDRLSESLTEMQRRRTERVLHDVLTPSHSAVVVQQLESEVLRPLCRAITADPGDERTLAQWAEAQQVSVRTLSRAFLAETGMGFSEWLAAVRAQRALVLLSSGVHVQDVAYEVGYATVNAFSAAFRRTTGITPGTVRSLTKMTESRN